MSILGKLAAQRGLWLVAGAVILAFAAGMLVRGGGPASGPADAGAAAEAAPTRWTCSMHPQIILPANDQKCPICFMDLIPVPEDAGDGLDPGDLRLSPAAVALAEIRTATVARRAVAHEVRLVGKVAADETRISTVTSRVAGRLDRLHVDATGRTVAPGDPLAEIYSPRLYAAQTELRAAAAAVDRARRAGREAAGAEATLAAAGERLRLLGLDRRQIDTILAGGPLQEHVTISATGAGVVVERRASAGDHVEVGDLLYAVVDLSRVWVVLAATERDLVWLEPGQTVAFTARALPGRRFEGVIQFIDQVLDERSRTVEVRVAVGNDDLALKPGMLVAAVAAAPAADAAATPLVIPATAPLLTGTRAVVYVRKPGGGDPVFSGRVVELGARAGDWYTVLSGLDEGEDVVVHGAFKLDSALQIQARPSMMNPAGSDGGASHRHGTPAAGHAGHAHRSADSGAPAEPLAASACLREGLAAVVEEYLPLQEALAGDDDARAAAAAAVLHDGLADLACDDLDPAAAAVWQGLRGELLAVTAAVAAAADIGVRRLTFEPLSDGLWTVLERFGMGEVRPVRRFHCPMALDGAGANWLQDGTTTANPYYGSSMLRCGGQVAVLGDPDGAAGESP